jgi:molybdopterin synthase sulfurtransferase
MNHKGNENMQQIHIISTEELKDKMMDPELKLVDIRPVEAYNGWQLHNEIRGGHIQGAKSLPFKWIKYIDWIEIVQSKGLLPTNQLIIYGYKSEQSQQVAKQFRKAGYSDVSIYQDFTNEWCPNNSLPIEKLSRYKHLVSAEWLQKLISTDKASEYENDKFVICHAHYQNKKDYEIGHIPQAISLDTNLLESSETWNRRSPEELHNVFKNLGITSDTTVILYGRFSHPNNNDPFPGSSAGHLGAIRCASIMLYAGVKDIRILNGGIQSWIDEGYELTTKEYSPQIINDFGAKIPVNPQYVIDTEKAKHILEANDKNLVSVRSWREYIGEVSGYHYIEKKGRIPGSVFGNCGSDAYHMENYRNLDHTTREYHEIEKMWSDVGITKEKHNSFYCGTGWRGSEAFFNAWLLGWDNISVYDGGWFEWSNNDNPYETGIPHKQKIKVE